MAAPATVATHHRTRKGLGRGWQRGVVFPSHYLWSDKMWWLIPIGTFALGVLVGRIWILQMHRKFTLVSHYDSPYDRLDQARKNATGGPC